MVRTKRRKPVLARKLRQIRMAMGLSQNEMIRTMTMEGGLLREEVSDFERNKRIRSHLVLPYLTSKLSIKLSILSIKSSGDRIQD